MTSPGQILEGRGPGEVRVHVWKAFTTVCTCMTYSFPDMLRHQMVGASLQSGFSNVGWNGSKSTASRRFKYASAGIWIISCFPSSMRATYSRQEQWPNNFRFYPPTCTLCLLVIHNAIIAYHPLDLSPSRNHLVHPPRPNLVDCIFQALGLCALPQYLLLDNAVALTHIARYVELVLALDQYWEIPDQ